MLPDTQILTQTTVVSNVECDHWQSIARLGPMLLALSALVIGILCGISCG